MGTKVRLNANIERSTYEEFQRILKANSKTITEFLEECINQYVREQRYVQDRRAFDELAGELATQELLAIERECSGDGLQ